MGNRTLFEFRYVITDKDTPCELQYVGVPIIDHETCKSTELGLTYKNSVQRDLPSIQMCAGHLEGGKDACQVSCGKKSQDGADITHLLVLFEKTPSFVLWSEVVTSETRLTIILSLKAEFRHKIRSEYFSSFQSNRKAMTNICKS